MYSYPYPDSNDGCSKSGDSIDGLPGEGERRSPPIAALLALIALATAWAALPGYVAAESPSPRATDDNSESATDEADAADEDDGKPRVYAEIEVSSTLPELLTEDDLSGERLESTGANDLVEGLGEVGGLGAVRRGPINLDPVVRGLSETQVASMVDGTRTYAAGPARMDSGLSHVSLHDVEEIRMVKGPYALAWGSGALSAIDLVTRRPAFDSGWSTHFGSSFDDNAERSDSFLNVRGGNDRWRMYLGGSRRSGGDYEAGDGSTVPGDYDSFETRWRFGWQPTSRLTLDLSGGYQNQEDIDYAGRLLDATYFYARSHALELDWSGDASTLDGAGVAVGRVYGQVYANRKDHLMNNDEKPTARDMPGRVPPFGLRIILPTESNTTGGRFRLELATDSDWSWSFGADASTSEQAATRTIARRSNDFLIFTDRVWPDAEVERVGLWAQAVRRVGKTRLGATVRVDDASSSVGSTTEFFRANVVGDLDQDDTETSFALSATVDLLPGWTLRGGVGQASRMPTVLERYSDRFPSTRFQISAEFMGTPTLDPEVARQLDLGLEYRTATALVSLDGYYREIDDYVTVAADPSLPKRLPLSPPTVFRYRNGDGSFVGAELSVDQRVTDRFGWSADVIWIRGDDDTLDEPALGVQPLTFEVGGRFEVLEGRLWVDAGVSIFDDQDRVAIARFEQPTDGATVFSLGAELELGAFRIDLDVENLGDEDYAHHLNAPVPFTGERVLEMGRTVRLGFRADL